MVKVVAGAFHTLVLKEDGSVWAFGRNDIGQCGVGGFGEPIGLSQVVGLTDIVDIAAGNFHSLALDSDGRVYTWGGNWSGQLGNGLHGYGDFSLVPQEVYLYDYYSAVAAAGDHSMALCNGYNHAWIAGWGDNYSGQLGFDDEDFLTYPRELWTSLGRVRKMSTGSVHTMGLTQEDVVASWGGNGSGQLGQGTEDGRALPDYVLNLENAADIAAGHSHSLAVTADGSVWAWGKNTNNALGMAGGGTVTEPAPVEGLSDIISVSAGAGCSIGIDTEGRLWTWGENYEGLLGADAPETQTEPQLYPHLSDVVQVSLGWSHAVALDADGNLWVWGNNGYGQLGDIALESTSVPTMVVEEYYPPVAVAWLEAYVYPQSLSIPETDDTMAWVYVTGYDYQGNGVVWYGFSFWLDGEYPGVSIDRQTGAITVTPEASAGPVIVRCSYGILNTTTIFILAGAETGSELTLSEQTLTIPRTGTETATATLYDETGEPVPNTQVDYYLPQSPTGMTISATGVITVSPGAQAGYVQVQAVWDGFTIETYLYLQYETPDRVNLTLTPETLAIPSSGSVTATAVAQALDTDGLVIPGHAFTYELVGAYTGVTLSASGVITVNDTALPGEVTVRAMCNGLESTATLTLTEEASAPTSMVLVISPNTLAIPTEDPASAAAVAHVYDADNEALFDLPIAYSLPGELVGVTINESSGQIVVTSAAQPGAVIVQAQCGELVASAVLVLTAGGPSSMSITVSPETLIIPTMGTVTAEAIATIYDQNNEVLIGQTIIYSLGEDADGTYAGVSINSITGVITVIDTASGGDITVRADCEGVCQTAILTLVRAESVPTTLSLTMVPNSLTIPKSGTATATASAKLLDQYGSSMHGQPITFSLVGTYSGVSINGETGMISVTTAAVAGNVTVKASSGSLTKTSIMTLNTASIPGSVSVFSGVLTSQDWFSYRQVTIPANSTLYFKMDQPRSTAVDYDLKLCDLQGNLLVPLPSDLYGATYGFGLVSPSSNFFQEDYSFANTLGSPITLYLMVVTGNGYVNSQEFTVSYHVVSGTVPQHDIFHATPISYNTPINVTMKSPIDCQWFVLNNPRANGFGVYIDSDTFGAQYAVEVINVQYQSTTGRYYFEVLPAAADGRYYLNESTYYIRLTSANNVVTPNQPFNFRLETNNAALIGSWSQPSYYTHPDQTSSNFVPAEEVTYRPFTKRLAIRKSIRVEGYIYDKNGQPLPNVPVTVMFYDPVWSNRLMKEKSNMAFTDSNGHYSITVEPLTAFGQYGFEAGYYSWRYDLAGIYVYFGAGAPVDSKDAYLIGGIIQ